MSVSEIPAKAISARTLDRAERVVVAALYAWFVYNIISGYLVSHDPLSLILLASESAVLVFVLFRRSTGDITREPLDWALGFAGTTSALLVLPNGAGPVIPAPIILFVMLCGATLQLTAKFFLRRSFGIVAANRGVMVGGPYRVIRHPMYAGYILNQLGFLLDNPSSWNLAVYCFCWGMQIGRIVVEERLLLKDEAYRLMVTRVPYRLIPHVF